MYVCHLEEQEFDPVVVVADLLSYWGSVQPLRTDSRQKTRWGKQQTVRIEINLDLFRHVYAEIAGIFIFGVCSVFFLQNNFWIIYLRNIIHGLEAANPTFSRCHYFGMLSSWVINLLCSFDILSVTGLWIICRNWLYTDWRIKNKQ